MWERMCVSSCPTLRTMPMPTHPEPQKYAVAGLHLGFRVDVVLQVEVRLERLICLLLLAQELDHLQGTLQLRHLLFQGAHLGQNVALQNAVLAEHNGDAVSAEPTCTPNAHTKGNRAARYVLLHLRQLGNHLIEPDWARLHESVNVVLCTVVHAHKPSTHQAFTKHTHHHHIPPHTYRRRGTRTHTYTQREHCGTPGLHVASGPTHTSPYLEKDGWVAHVVLRPKNYTLFGRDWLATPCLDGR